MEHRTLVQLERAGDVANALPLNRNERLCRWASALEKLASMPLSTIWRTEFNVSGIRASMRADNSPFSVAFNDPVLRAAGLKDDSFGEAKRFFEVSDRQLHWLVCSCHHGASIPADRAARYVLKLASGQRNWLARLFG
jgi:hypothetical protein